MNEARPKRLEHIFGKVEVIDTTVLVPMEHRYTMRPYIPHSSRFHSHNQ